MGNKKFEEALYEAFLEAGLRLGNRAKGMSCFLHNWKSAGQSYAEQTEKAA